MEVLRMVEKRFLRVKLSELVPYENNPRNIPEEAVDAVRESIRQCGDLDPIEVDENMVILSGHTRRLAYIEANVDEVDIVQYFGLTDEQKKKYRLLANKTGELSGWDFGKLDIELPGLDFEGYDFGFDVDKSDFNVDDFFDEVPQESKEKTLGVRVVCDTMEELEGLEDSLEKLGYEYKRL